MRQHEGYGDLPGLDEVAIDLPDCRTDRRVRTVGPDHYLGTQTGAGRCLYSTGSVDRPNGFAVAALSSVSRCFLRQHAVEFGAIDHETLKMLGHLRRPLPDKGQHASDFLLGYRVHSGNIVLDQGRHEFRALYRRAGGPPPLQGDDVEPGGCCRRRSAASCGPEPDHNNVRRFDLHTAPYAAQARRPARPSSAIEQQAWSCSIGRPMAVASATMPSAG